MKSTVMLLALFVFMELLRLAAACAPPPCVPGETRCDLESVVICDSVHRWRVAEDCDGTVNWTCCWSGGMCRCSAGKECEVRL